MKLGAGRVVAMGEELEGIADRLQRIARTDYEESER